MRWPAPGDSDRAGSGDAGESEEAEACVRGVEDASTEAEPCDTGDTTALLRSGDAGGVPCDATGAPAEEGAAPG